MEPRTLVIIVLLIAAMVWCLIKMVQLNQTEFSENAWQINCTWNKLLNQYYKRYDVSRGVSYQARELLKQAEDNPEAFWEFLSSDPKKGSRRVLEELKGEVHRDYKPEPLGRSLYPQLTSFLYQKVSESGSPHISRPNGPYYPEGSLPWCLRILAGRGG